MHYGRGLAVLKSLFHEGGIANIAFDEPGTNSSDPRDTIDDVGSAIAEVV
jgi:hypothetical protein